MTQNAASALWSQMLQLEHAMDTAREKGQRGKYADLAAEYQFIRAERQRVLKAR